MPKPRKATPRFASEKAERAYWEKADSTAHLDWSNAARVELPTLKPNTMAIRAKAEQ